MGLSVSMVPSAIKEIESFTDHVCKSLYINETYYGNILMTLTGVFDLCLEFPCEDTVTFSYSTDYQIVKVDIGPVSSALISMIEQEADLGEDEWQARLFMIHKLSDGIEVADDHLILHFDIGAMHNKVYQERMKHLHTYLNQFEGKVSHKRND